MGSASSSSHQACGIRLVLILIAASIFSTGCGSGSASSPSAPVLSGNTSVTVLLSSTANDQLSQFGIGFQSISLTSQSGKTVTLLSMPRGTEQNAEFIHVNGGAEPLITVSIPQDVYTSATVAVDQSYFVCVTLGPQGGLVTSAFAYGTNPNNAPSTAVTVNLPSPITVAGSSMGLALDLMVAQSASYSSCYVTGIEPYSITPTFTLAPIAFAPQPTSSAKSRNSRGKSLRSMQQATALRLPCQEAKELFRSAPIRTQHIRASVVFRHSPQAPLSTWMGRSNVMGQSWPHVSRWGIHLRSMS